MQLPKTSHAGLPWVVDLRVATRPLYALHRRVINLEAAIDAAVSVLQQDKRQRAEALGLALSRLYLEHQGVFENQVVVPLDAHLELYRVLKAQANELGDEVSLRRTDLGLFDLDITRRTITCRLVEVKCYSGVGDLAQYKTRDLEPRVAVNEQLSAIGHLAAPFRRARDHLAG
jgi:hypothetical protein